MQRSSDRLVVACRRNDGKTWSDEFPLPPLSEEAFLRACNHSQSHLRHAFCELLRPYPGRNDLVLWEYDDGRSYFRLEDGHEYEPDDTHIPQRIHEATGLSIELIEAGLEAYITAG